MAARTQCTACLRLLRKNPAVDGLRTTPPYPSVRRSIRPLTTSNRKIPEYSTPKPRPAPPSPPPPPGGKPSQAMQNEMPPVKPEERPSMAPSLAQEVRSRAPALTETYVAYGVCEILAKECARVADYTIPQAGKKGEEVPKSDKGEDLGVGTSWWYKDFHLKPTFNTWAHVTLLHLYLLTVRLRAFPAAHAPAWHQHLTDHFFYLAEERMTTLHGMAARSVRNRYLKDLFAQYRGLTAAYDEGLVRGDAVLAAALWRNVCGADEDVDLVGLAQVVSYVRAVLKGLERMPDEDVAAGKVVFEDPAQERDVVAARSPLMDDMAEGEEEKDGAVGGAAATAGKWTKAPVPRPMA